LLIGQVGGNASNKLEQRDVPLTIRERSSVGMGRDEKTEIEVGENFDDCWKLGKYQGEQSFGHCCSANETSSGTA
jgi:hypothetical protein